MKKIIFLFCLSFLILSCSTPLAIVFPTATVKPAPTIVFPTLTLSPSPLPSTTPSPTLLPSDTPTPEAPFVNRTNIALIALEDNGKTGMPVGCGDSILKVNVNIPGTKAPLKAAYEYLLSLKKERYGDSGLYNALYRSDLKVVNVSIINNVAKVRLTGQLVMGGECDAPRIQAQLEQVAYQYETVKEVDITINNQPLKSLLSSK